MELREALTVQLNVGRRVAFSFVMLVAATSPQCAGRDRSFEPVVYGLMERSKPDGGEVLDFSRIRQDESGIRASWDVETRMPWAAYSAWVRMRMPPDFTAIEVDGASIAFRKATEADVYVIHITPIPSSTRVRAAFDGRPH